MQKDHKILTSALTNQGLYKMTNIFADISKVIFANEQFHILIKISLKFVPEALISNKSVLVQVTAQLFKAHSHSALQLNHDQNL